MRDSIVIKDVSKSYKKKGSKRYIEAIKNVSFSIKEGEVVGLLGPNGAGKSTIIKILCGLTTADTGEIKFLEKGPKSKFNSLGVVLEGNRNLYWNMTINENIRFILSLNRISMKKKKDVIELLFLKFKLIEKKNELVSNLSRGMQQKVAIMIALLIDSNVLLLDEPTLGLDVHSIIEMKAILIDIAKEFNRTILISSHDMRFIEDICDRVIILNEGSIVSDGRIEDLKNYFNMNVYEIAYNVEKKINIHKLINDSDIDCIIKVEEESQNIFISDYHGKEITVVLNYLQNNNIDIIGIKSKAIEMEEIFLKIIGGES